MFTKRGIVILTAIVTLVLLLTACDQDPTGLYLYQQSLENPSGPNPFVTQQEGLGCCQAEFEDASAQSLTPLACIDGIDQINCEVELLGVFTEGGTCVEGICTEAPQEPVCPNEVVEPPEECDPPGVPGQCPNNGLCKNDCTCPFCGDSIINQDNEICDPPLESSEQCGGLECFEDCTCEIPPEPFCGDGIINLPGEICDPPSNPSEECGGLECFEDCTCKIPPEPPEITTDCDDFIGKVGEIFTPVQFEATGVGPFVWSAIGLPLDMELTIGGVLQGIPAIDDIFVFTVTVFDTGTELSSDKECTIDVHKRPEITSPECNIDLIGKIGEEFSQVFTGEFGFGELTFIFEFTDQDPGGLTFENDDPDATSATLSGIPETDGDFPFTVVLTDELEELSEPLECTLSIHKRPEITSPTCDEVIPAKVDLPFPPLVFTGQFGFGELTFILEFTDQDPGGLTLNNDDPDANSATLTGTPESVGIFPFTVTLIDELEEPSIPPLECTLNIHPPPEIIFDGDCEALEGVINQPQQHVFDVIGGVPPYEWVTVPEPAVPGMDTITPTSPTSSLIAGTPNTVGEFPFTVIVTDVFNEIAELPCKKKIRGCGDEVIDEDLGEECDPPGNNEQCPGNLECKEDCTCPELPPPSRGGGGEASGGGGCTRGYYITGCAGSPIEENKDLGCDEQKYVPAYQTLAYADADNALPSPFTAGRNQFVFSTKLADGRTGLGFEEYLGEPFDDWEIEENIKGSIFRRLVGNVYHYYQEVTESPARANVYGTDKKVGIDEEALRKLDSNKDDKKRTIEDPFHLVKTRYFQRIDCGPPPTFFDEPMGCKCGDPPSPCRAISKDQTTNFIVDLIDSYPVTIKPIIDWPDISQEIPELAPRAAGGRPSIPPELTCNYLAIKDIQYIVETNEPVAVELIALGTEPVVLGETLVVSYTYQDPQKTFREYEEGQELIMADITGMFSLIEGLISGDTSIFSSLNDAISKIGSSLRVITSKVRVLPGFYDDLNWLISIGKQFEQIGEVNKKMGDFNEELSAAMESGMSEQQKDRFKQQVSELRTEIDNLDFDNPTTEYFTAEEELPIYETIFPPAEQRTLTYKILRARADGEEIKPGDEIQPGQILLIELGYDANVVSEKISEITEEEFYDLPTPEDLEKPEEPLQPLEEFSLPDEIVSGLAGDEPVLLNRYFKLLVAGKLDQMSGPEQRAVNSIMTKLGARPGALQSEGEKSKIDLLYELASKYQQQTPEPIGESLIARNDQ